MPIRRLLCGYPTCWKQHSNLHQVIRPIIIGGARDSYYFHSSEISWFKHIATDTCSRCCTVGLSLEPCGCKADCSITQPCLHSYHCVYLLVNVRHGWFTIIKSLVWSHCMVLEQISSIVALNHTKTCEQNWVERNWKPTRVTTFLEW